MGDQNWSVRVGQGENAHVNQVINNLSVHRSAAMPQLTVGRVPPTVRVVLKWLNKSAKKVKVAHTRLPMSVGFRSRSRFLAVSLQMM